MRTEVEAKFTAHDAATLAALATMPTLGAATLGPMRRVSEIDRYLDTADGRLAASRWACRLRSRDGAWRVSLKGPPLAGSGGGMLHRRPEVEGPATEVPDPGDWPRGRARALLEALSGGAALGELLVLDQVRGERGVDVDGRLLATLSLDEVRVRRRGAGDVGELRVVELEALPRAPQRAFEALADALAAVDGLVPEPLTKLERALDLLDGAA